MATATRKSRAAKQHAHNGPDLRVPESMEFAIYEDNGGSYHWTIVGEAGRPLVESDGFASYDEAERAARAIRDDAGSARFEPRTADDPPVDLVARRDALADNSDAERWLDEGGSFSSESVTKWAAEQSQGRHRD